MKKIALISLIMIVSCKSKSNSDENQNQNINRVWMLTVFNDFEKSKLIDYKAQMDLTDKERVTANMGCNTIGFLYKIGENNSISFSEGLSTRMFCDDKMDLETSFSKEIRKYSVYKVEGHKLTLINPQGKKMEFIAQDWD